MSQEQEQAETREQIRKLRESYARLQAICGPRGISKETTQEYEKKIKTLLEKLILGPPNILNPMSAGRGRQTTATTMEVMENDKRKKQT